MFAIFILAFYSAVFAAQTECPKWTHELTPFNVQFQNAAVSCRAECQDDQDCIVEQDGCGRRFAIHRKYQDEAKKEMDALKPSDCPKVISLPLNEKASCLKNRCQFKPESCDSSYENMKSYLQKNFDQNCTQDKDCSYLVQATPKCLDFYPINVVQKEKINQYELNYLTNKVLKFCSNGKTKYCGSKKISQCFMGQCIQAEKKIPFISYVNFEGPKYKPNFNSRTTPLLLPKLSEITCYTKADCAVAFGVCEQYAVALGKKFSRTFQEAVRKKAATIACPVTTGVVAPKADCVDNYCVFAEK